DGGEVVAGVVRVVEGDVWCLAAPYDIEQTRAFDEARYRRDFLQGLGCFDKRHVRTRTQSGIGTLDRLIEPQDSPRIRARDDDELRILSGCDSSPNFRQIIFQGDDHLVVQMPALLREALVLDVHKIVR